MKQLFLTLIFILSLDTNAQKLERAELLTVISGNKLELLIQGKKQVVEVAGVVIPDLKTKEGKEAKKITENWLTGKLLVVHLYPKGKSKILIKGVTDLAEKQLEWGYGWINYKTILSEDKTKYEAAVELAKIRKTGVYASKLKTPKEAKK